MIKSACDTFPVDEMNTLKNKIEVVKKNNWSMIDNATHGQSHIETFYYNNYNLINGVDFYGSN